MTAPLQSGQWGVEGSVPLLVVIVVAGLGTGALFLLSLAAYGRRGTTQHGLISIAVGALLARSIIGAGTVFGHVPMIVHHFVEHSLDFLVSAVILYAVYRHAPGSLNDHEEA